MDKKGIKKRADWEMHHETVYNAFFEIANEKKRYPKLKDIADKTGLSIVSVHNHIKDIDFEEIKAKYSIFTEAAMFNLAKNAASGKSKDWVELYFRIVHGVGDKKQVDITSGGDPFKGYQVIIPGG